ncbi:MAG: hypothetical protein ABIY51_04155 [Ferruginibacter sp.]
MSQKPRLSCLYCILFILGLLLFQETNAQYDFRKHSISYDADKVNLPS